MSTTQLAERPAKEGRGKRRSKDGYLARLGKKTMKFSESWLREYVNPPISTEQLVEQLTMAGLEVDGFDPVASEFSNVVVGEILNVDAHPRVLLQLSYLLQE